MNSFLSVIAALLLVLQSPVCIPGPCFSHRTTTGALVQFATCEPTSAPFNCAFTNPVGSGNSVVFVVNWITTGGVTLTSVADGDSNSYSTSAWASGGTACAINSSNSLAYTLANITNGDSGTQTITANFSSAPSFTTVITMLELSGVPSASIVDALDCAQQVSTTTPTSPSITPSGADFLIGIAYNSNLDTRTFSAGSNVAWVGHGATTNFHYTETFTPATSGVGVTANFSVNSADTFSTAIIAVKP
jgi:hypothetical protein